MIVINQIINGTVHTRLITDSFHEASDAFYSLIKENNFESDNYKIKQIDNHVIFEAESDDGDKITLQSM